MRKIQHANINQSKYLAIDQMAENFTRDEDDSSTKIKYSSSERSTLKNTQHCYLGTWKPKTTMRYHFTHNTNKKIHKTAGKHVEKLEPSNIASGNVKQWNCCVKVW